MIETILGIAMVIMAIITSVSVSYALTWKQERDEQFELNVHYEERIQLLEIQIKEARKNNIRWIN